MLIYRIKNTKTGMYSNGGSYPRWSKKGKIWKTLGYVRSHLRAFMEYDYRKKTTVGIDPKLKDWVIETSEITEQPRDVIAVMDCVKDMLTSEQVKLDKEHATEERLKSLKKKAISKLTAAEKDALGIGD